MIFPWFQSTQEKLSKAYQDKRLPHAILIAAGRDYGKYQFAYYWIAGLLCEESQRVSLQQQNGQEQKAQNEPQNQWHPACGRCKSCLLFDASTHPDFYLVDYLTDSKGKQKASIGIDQIRQLTHKLTETSQLNGWKVGLIRSVTDMTTGAFNALLKTLEEPSDKTVLLLLTDHLQRVPATIKSRCQIMQPKSSRDEIIHWLQEETQQSPENIKQALTSCFNSPLAARQYLENDYQQVEENFFSHCDQVLLNQAFPEEILALEDLGWQQQFQLLSSYFYRVQQACLKGEGLSQYQSLPSRLPFQLYSALLEFNRAQLAGSNLQPQIQFQEILIKWFEAGRKIAYLSKA
jgi:DNA polymerase-3 subunit delta'